MNRRILELFTSFFRIGLFTFGGGYAMIPLIEREVIERKKWIDGEDMLSIIAIAESTPGPLAINSATFIGYKVCGIWGSVAATLGVVLPSFVIIAVISLFLNQVKQNRWVDYAFRGIRSGVIVLMINAVLKLSKALSKEWFTYVVIALVFALAAFTDISSIILLVCAAAAGLLTQWALCKSRRGGDA